MATEHLNHPEHLNPRLVRELRGRFDDAPQAIPQARVDDQATIDAEFVDGPAPLGVAFLIVGSGLLAFLCGLSINLISTIQIACGLPR